MNLEAISKRIVDLGLGVEGVSLFLHEMPSECQRGILLRTPLIGVVVDHELPRYHRGGLQVIVRDKSHEAGEDRAQQLYRQLTLQGVTLLDDGGGGMRLNHLLPKTLPVKYRRSDGNGIEWSINFEGSYVMLDA